MTAQDRINNEIAELVDSWGLSSVIAAVSLATSKLAAEEQDGHNDPKLKELHRRLNELTNWAYEEGY